MCTVNRLFKHIIPKDGNDGNVTCCRTLRMPTCYKAAAIGQSLIDGQEVHKVIFFLALRERNGLEHRHMPAPIITETHRQAQSHKHKTEL